MKLILLMLFIILPMAAAQEAINVQITIPEQYAKVAPGEDAVASIKLLNHGSKGREDVVMSYWIEGDKKMQTATETVAVETQANFLRALPIPPDAVEGNYRFNVEILFDDGRKAAAVNSFEVVHEQYNYFNYMAAALPVLAVVLLLFRNTAKKFLRKMLTGMKIRKIVRQRLSAVNPR